MGYLDLNTIHNPATLTAPPAAWGDQIRDNDEYLLNRGPFICTSGTRPGSPFEGMSIYETDTDEFLIYHGTAWRRPWHMPWGRIDHAEVTANQNGFSTIVDLTSLSVVFTPVTGRRYRITGSAILSASAATTQVVGYICSGVAGGTQHGRFGQHVGSAVGDVKHEGSALWTAPNGTAITFRLRAEANITGTGSMSAAATVPAWILVEDIGSTASPA